MREKDDELARIAMLEEELEVARQKVGQLGGTLEATDWRSEQHALDRSSTRGGAAQRWLGAPLLLKIARRFEGKYPPGRFEVLIERLREITHDPGDVDLKEQSLVWSSSNDRHPIQSHFMVRVTIVESGPPYTPERREDVPYYTTLTVTDELGALVGRLFGAFGSILGAGGIAAPIAASIALPAFAPAFVLGWLGSVYGTTRLLFRKLARGRATRLEQLFGALALEIEPNLEEQNR